MINYMGMEILKNNISPLAIPCDSNIFVVMTLQATTMCSMFRGSETEKSNSEKI